MNEKIGVGVVQARLAALRRVRLERSPRRLSHRYQFTIARLRNGANKMIDAGPAP